LNLTSHYKGFCQFYSNVLNALHLRPPTCRSFTCICGKHDSQWC